MQTPFRILFPLLVSAFTLSINAAEKVVIRQHWEPGKLYKQETVTDMSMTMPGLGAAGEQKTYIAQQLTVGVTSQAGTSNKTAEVKFAGIKANMNMLGQTMTYDSADPSKSQPFLQQSFGAMVGKSFTIVYDKDNHFVSVSGLDSLAATPLGKTQAMDGNQLAEMFRKSSELGLPKTPVAVGDTWTSEETLEMQPLGKMKITAQGKLDAIESRQGVRTAVVSLSGTFAIEGDNPLVKLGEGSKFTGQILFDLDRKVIVSHVADTVLNMNVAGKDTPVVQKVSTVLNSIEDLK